MPRFHTFNGQQSFGVIGVATCAPKAGVTTVPLDFSLQMQVSVQSSLQFNDVNPCAAHAPAALDVPPLGDYADAPRGSARK
jgi:hypothetical protein